MGNISQTDCKDASGVLPDLPSEIWQIVGEKLAEKGHLRARSHLAQVRSSAIKDGLGTLYFGIPAETPEKTLQFLKKYAKIWRNLDHPHQTDLMREAITAGREGNREPAHLALLAAAWATRSRTTFRKKEQELHSADHVACHWAAVLNTFEHLLSIHAKVITIARDIARDAASEKAWSAARDAVLDAALDAALDTARDAVLNAVLDAVSDAVRDAVRDADDAAKHAAKETAWSAALDKVRDAADAALEQGFEQGSDNIWLDIGNATKDEARNMFHAKSSSQMIGAVAYRIAETAVLLSLISQDDDLADFLYQRSSHHLSNLGTPPGDLRRKGPLASEKDFNTWKVHYFGAIQGEESRSSFVRDMVAELEMIATRYWALLRDL